jgi:membrane fusion protein (multidrug efflux system)
MATTPIVAERQTRVEHTINPFRAAWLTFGTPVLVVLMASAIALTMTRNWNAWEGGRAEQVTDDATVRRDVTPLGTKVVGLVREVKVSDYQRVQKGDELVRLEDEDYRAQVAQAVAAVDAARAAVENNRRQHHLQDTRIERALAGIDQAQAQIAAAHAGTEAVHADVLRTNAERSRQEALFSTGSATRQRVESAVADSERFSAQLASREADLAQARTLLRSNELAVETERRSQAVLQSQELQLAADVHAKEAALAVAQVNLNYTRIVAPADGAVGERQVRPGQLVSPGTQVLSFVDGTAWVQANFRETQLRNIKIDDPVDVRIDVYPGEVMRGRVLEISPASGSQFALLPPDNATGNFTKVVQRVPVTIALVGFTPTLWLRSGLSAVVTVRTQSRGRR